MRKSSDFPWLRQAIVALGIKDSFTYDEREALLDFAELFDRRVKRPERQERAIARFIFEKTLDSESSKHASKKLVALLQAEDNTFDEPKEIETLLQVYSPKATPPTEEERAHLRAFCKSYVRRVTKLVRQQAVVTGELYDSALQFEFPLGMNPTVGEIIVRIYNSTL